MKMEYIFCCIKKMKSVCISSWKVTKFVISRGYRHLLFKSNAFFMHIFYLVSLSLLGFGILKALKPRTTSSSSKLRNIDLLFTSVSATTVSSMLTLEMEDFSQEQLMVMALLMFLGGEIFTSMARLHLNAFKTNREPRVEVRVESVESNEDPSFDRIELSVVEGFEKSLKYDSIKFLGILVLCYILVVHIVGVVSVVFYLALVSSAEKVLRNKGIKTSIFAVFTVVSTFANCGFIPTNENMIVFSKNSGLLLILIPQILLGNTLFPSALRVILWLLGKKYMRAEAKYLLENSRQVGFLHLLLPSLHSWLLAATGLGFLLIGFVLYSSLQWHTEGSDGLNTYQKVVAILFQCINTRHAGENIVDLSTIAPAILVFFLLMMHLPPYTLFLPSKVDEHGPLKLERKEKKREILVKDFIFSHLSYIAIFIILICITERKSLKQDPINFSVLNIAFEVISAYGNVGLTTGYSCDRQLSVDPKCVTKWYGFVGKWSNEGKTILIIIMIFGKLKKFNTKGGRAWKLL